jgi:hypothetical protein
MMKFFLPPSSLPPGHKRSRELLPLALVPFRPRHTHSNPNTHPRRPTPSEHPPPSHQHNGGKDSRGMSAGRDPIPHAIYTLHEDESYPRSSEVAHGSFRSIRKFLAPVPWNTHHRSLFLLRLLWQPTSRRSRGGGPRGGGGGPWQSGRRPQSCCERPTTRHDDDRLCGWGGVGGGASWEFVMTTSSFVPLRRPLHGERRPECAFVK